MSVKKYLTQEEYEEQGKRETDLGLVSLRDQINSSPEPMKLLKKLHPDTRNKIINFATGADHIDSDDSSDLDLNSHSDEEDIDSTDGEHTRNALSKFRSANYRTNYRDYFGNMRQSFFITL